MDTYTGWTSERFAGHLTRRLAVAYQGKDPGEPVYLRLLPSQGAGWSAPADVIEAFDSRLPSDVERAAFRESLGQILVLARPHELPAGALEDVIHAIGSLRVSSQLLPSARSLAAADWWDRDDLNLLHEAMLMVLKGFQGLLVASQAARELLSSERLDSQYVVDALEVVLTNAAELWTQRLREIEAPLVEAMREDPFFSVRIADLAKDSLSDLSEVDAKQGLIEIAGVSEWLDIGHPIGRLLRCLFAEEGSPFLLETKAGRVDLVKRSTRTRAKLPPMGELELFLEVGYEVAEHPKRLDRGRAVGFDFAPQRSRLKN